MASPKQPFSTPAPNGSIFSHLWFRVALGLLLGIAFGLAMGKIGADSPLGADGKTILTEYVKPVGTVFINMIKMVVVPLIFFSLINGITSMTNAESFKRVGLKSVAAFLMTGALAVCIGLAFGTFFQPGIGVNLNSLESHVAAAKSAAPPARTSLIQIFVDIVPTNIFKAMADDNILQVVVFAIH